MKKKEMGKRERGKGKGGGGARQLRPRPRSATRGVVTRERATRDGARGQEGREEQGEREKEGARFAVAARNASRWMGKKMGRELNSGVGLFKRDSRVQGLRESRAQRLRKQFYRTI